ncbi:unnamed protein product [Heterobilharzia americana]|nr:unnamed protein product [Heterobilharzia americana]
MLYLTLGYDWFLFGHKLQTRMELGEEILRFTFKFISEMAHCTDLSLRTVYDIHVADESKSSEFDQICIRENMGNIRCSPIYLTKSGHMTIYKSVAFTFHTRLLFWNLQFLGIDVAEFIANRFKLPDSTSLYLTVPIKLEKDSPNKIELLMNPPKYLFIHFLLVCLVEIKNVKYT